MEVWIKHQHIVQVQQKWNLLQNLEWMRNVDRNFALEIFTQEANILRWPLRVGKEEKDPPEWQICSEFIFRFFFLKRQLEPFATLLPSAERHSIPVSSKTFQKHHDLKINFFGNASTLQETPSNFGLRCTRIAWSACMKILYHQCVRISPLIFGMCCMHI